MNKKEVKSNIVRIFIFVIGVFLLALNYNMFIIPNNLVIGGTSGIAIILKKLINLEPKLFLYFINALLIIVSFAVLGNKKTLKSMVGAFLYPIFVSLTEPLANAINLTFENELILMLVTGVLLGVGNGLTYKAGFTTGGSDIIIQIIGEKRKMTMGNALLIFNIMVIFSSGFLFGFEKVIYAALILGIDSILVDRILLGISNSKMFFIYTTKLKKVEKFILNEIKTGVTIIDVEGGYTKKKDKMLMCVVRTRDYFLFKETILKIDPNAFFIINDCYEVMGGVKRRNLPFLSI